MFINNFVWQEVAQECHDMNWGTFKVVLTDALIDHLHPIQVPILLLDFTLFFMNVVIDDKNA